MIKLKKLIKEDYNNEMKITITLNGNENSIMSTLAFLKVLEYNGNIGHSAMFGMWFDGDGSDQFKITGISKDIEKELKDKTETKESYKSNGSLDYVVYPD